jgi:drug/metabolite transporter (DMT)-like permease
MFKDTEEISGTIMTEDMPVTRELPFLAAVFSSMLCIVFGSNAVAIKISLSGLGAFTTAGFRFAMAALAIYLWARLTGRPFGLRKGQIRQVLVVSVLFTVQLSLLYLGLTKTNASRATLLINLQPFFVLILANYFVPGDQITKKKSLGLLLGFAGMASVFLGKEGITADVQIGDFLILNCAFLWACNAIYIKRIIHAFDFFHITLYPMIFSVPFFFLGALLWDSAMISYVDSEVLGALLYQGLITASFGFLAWNHMLQKYGAVALHSFIFLMPVAGVMLGGILLGEPITYNIVLALILIVSGILVVNLKTGKYTRIFSTKET